ncbi:hypothetical protein JCM11251_004466 [Rhodosporidiobolus azoricus]
MSSSSHPQQPDQQFQQHYHQSQQLYHHRQWNAQGEGVWIAAQPPLSSTSGVGEAAWNGQHADGGGYGLQGQYDYVVEYDQSPSQAVSDSYPFPPPPPELLPTVPQPPPPGNSSFSAYAHYPQYSSAALTALPPPAPVLYPSSASYPSSAVAPPPPSQRKGTSLHPSAASYPSPYAPPSKLPTLHLHVAPSPPPPAVYLPAQATVTEDVSLSASPVANKKRRVSFAAAGDETTTGSFSPGPLVSGALVSRRDFSAFLQHRTSGSEASTPAAAAVKEEEDVEEAGTDGKVKTEKAAMSVNRADKSCKTCRARKVRCTRTWPSCQRCIDRKLECHYGNLIPIDLVKNLDPSGRVAELEARIKSLEMDLATSHAKASGPRLPTTPTNERAPLLPSQQPLSHALHHALLSPLSSFPFLSSPEGRLQHARAVLSSVLNRAVGDRGQGPWKGKWGPPSKSGVGGGRGEGVPGVCVAGKAGKEGQEGKVEESEDQKEWRVWREMVEQDEAEARNLLALLDGHGEEASGGGRKEGGVNKGVEPDDSDMGPAGLRDQAARHERDRLVRGWMSGEGRWARWVAWGCLDAFWSTCSSNIPTFRMFHSPARKLRLYTQIDALPPAERVIVCAFAAVGIRGWAGEELLGLASLPPTVGELEEGQGADQTAEGRLTDPSLGVKRELQTRSVRGLMLALYDELEVGVGEGTKGALEASVICGSVMMCAVQTLFSFFSSQHARSAGKLCWRDATDRNELIPRRSRSCVRTALGMYRDLISSLSAAAAEAEAAGDEERRKKAEAEQVDTVMLFGLPLLLQDSTTAAYLRAAPLITSDDLSTHFAAFPLPSFPPSPLTPSTEDLPAPGPPSPPAKLKDDIASFVDLDKLEGAEHMQLTMGSMVVWKWLAGCLRKVAEMSCPKGVSKPFPASSLHSLFTTLSALHTALQTFQNHLCNLPTIHAHPTCLSDGPEGGTCESVHLRWCTRLDREVDDAVWLLYGAIGERMWSEQERTRATLSVVGSEMGGHAGKGMVEGEEEAGGRHAERLNTGWLEMCESRVRQGLKLAAFYFNFFLISPDPHQTHHLAWGLELIPHWTFLATQRYTPPSDIISSTSYSTPLTSPTTTHGPGAPCLSRKSDELTETELDWMEAGLVEACKYHPVAERRLVELRAYRSGNEKSRAEGAEVFIPSPPTPTLSTLDASTSLTPGMDFLPTPSTASASPVTISSAPSTASGTAGLEQQQQQQPGTTLGFQQAMQVAIKMRVPT